VVVGALVALGLHDFLLSTYHRHPFGPSERLATEARVLWDYVHQLTLPQLSGFGFYADRFDISDFGDLETYAALTGWALALTASFAVRFRAPLAALGVLWFLAAHSLESSFIGLAVAFEHRNYLAAFGITLILAELVTRWPGRRAKVACATFGIPLAGLFLFQTGARVMTWTDYERLTRTAVIEHPSSALARAEYARLLLRRGRIDDGLDHLRAGMRNAPHDAGFAVIRLTQACLHQRYRIHLYTNARKALRNEHVTVYATNALRRLQQRVLADRCKEVSERDLLALLNAALTDADERAPKSARAIVHRLRGELLAKGFANYSDALEAFRRASQLDPRWGPAWTNRVRLHLRLGQPERARAVLTAMYERFPWLPPLSPERVAKLRQRIEQTESRSQVESAQPSSKNQSNRRRRGVAASKPYSTK
jgi:tetratricopeptide (TPR) repeat protein